MRSLRSEWTYRPRAAFRTSPALLILKSSWSTLFRGMLAPIAMSLGFIGASASIRTDKISARSSERRTSASQGSGDSVSAMIP